MTSPSRIPLFLLLIITLSCQKSPQPAIALITGGNQEAEEQAWLQFAEENLEEHIQTISWADIASGSTDLADYELIWFHQVETSEQAAAGSAKTPIQEYLNQGGRLILDMEAVRLLNTWEIEPETFQTQTDTITDTGFGRPLGFHAFKDHPLFNKLHGGAYPWKSKEDHLVRKTGFFGETLPGNTQAKVIGTQWTYITFHPDAKLVLEYPVGKGNILAIGAYTYFEPENYNRQELYQFYQNAVDYLTGQVDGPANYWTYEAQEVLAQSLPAPGTALPPATRWTTPDWSISARSEEPGEAFVDLAGRRMLVMGKEKGGIDEIWSHPFMAARDLQAGLVRNGQVQWLDQMEGTLTISPELLLREYQIAGQTVKEYITVSFDEPIALFHYELPEALEAEGVIFQSTFNGRYMWPYDETATKSIQYHYDPDSRTLQLAAQDKNLSTLLGFSHPPSAQTIGRYETFAQNEHPQAEGVETKKTQVASRFFFEREGFGENLDIVLCSSSEGIQTLLNTYEKNLSDLNSLYEQTNQYYRELQSQKLSITSPDPIFNEGYRWALARTDQFFQTTPNIGTTHMAGFGTTARGWNGRHEVSGRPGYAWYFGRDGEWSGMAVNAYGDFGWVKEMLKVFERYQNLSGKIFHELTTSGAVHYDASDASPLYVILAAQYLKYSNDQAFIQELWPSLQKAIDFCYSTDTDGDGLIENTNVGHGWIEGGALFNVHTEFYLAGSWAACLDAGAYMANILGKPELEEKYRSDAQKVKSIIDESFWDAEEQYFYNGKYSDGSYQTEASVLQSVPVYLNTVSDPTKAKAALSPFARRAMTTDWGIRMIAEDNPKFNPVSYHAGMVWPLYGGWASLGEYETGFYNSGFFHFYANLINFSHWGKGSVEETLHGEFFQPAGVCSQQCWSETMVLLPIIEGMLGLRPDAPKKRLALNPRFPIHWPIAEVKNIRMEKTVLDLNWEKEEGLTTLQLTRTDADGPEVELSLCPALPLGSEVLSLTLNDQDHAYELIQGPESIEVQLTDFSIKPGEEITVKIVHSGGIGIAPLTIFPKEEAKSEGARILSQQLTDDGWQVRFDGVAGKSYTATLWSEEEIQGISGGRIVERAGALYTIEFRGTATISIER